MPTYEYRCQECGHDVEAFQNMGDAPLTECPQCGGNLQRLITGGSGFVLKGSGFYQNDYKKSLSNWDCSRGESCDNPKRCCEH